MDQRVLAAKAADGEAGDVELVPGGRIHDLAGHPGRRGTHRGSQAGRGVKHRGRIGGEGLDHGLLVDVVGVFVRDQDRLGAGQGGPGFGEHARIKGDGMALLFEADTGVGVLGEQHGASL